VRTTIGGACHQSLRGRDLAPSRTVKVVRVANDRGASDLVGCVLPRGRIVTLARGGEFETQSNGYAIRQVAGRIVLLQLTFSSQYGLSERTSAFDVRTGHEYAIALPRSLRLAGHVASWTHGGQPRSALVGTPLVGVPRPAAARVARTPAP
jgi:hypothetical protein